MSKFFDQALERAKRFEGFSATPYKCPAGKWTIGYGLNLERGKFSPEVQRILGRGLLRAVTNGSCVKPDWGGLYLTIPDAEDILRDDLLSHWRSLSEAKPFVGDLHISARLVLLDMAINMGVKGLLGFKGMFVSLERGDWVGAGRELMDSRYATKLEARASANRNMLEDLGAEDLSLAQRVGRLEHASSTPTLAELQRRGLGEL